MVKNNIKQHSDTDAELLNIDFNLHTDGDAEFKIELIDLMINNVRELQWSLRLHGEVFKKVCHKIKSTLLILNCNTLNEIITDLSNENATDRWSKTNSLTLICDDIVKSLELEKNR